MLALLLPLAYVVLPNASPSLAAPAGSAFIRVNQVGYPDSASKRAYLMSTDVETGATFTVRTGGATVFTGSVGSDLGKWSKTYTHVYPLDFDAFATAGTYTIEVAGPRPGHVASLPDRHRHEPVCGLVDQRPALLRQRARRRRTTSRRRCARRPHT